MEASLRGKNGDASCGVSSTGQAEHACFIVIGVLNFSHQGSEIEKREVYGDSQVSHVFLKSSGHIGTELIFLVCVQGKFHKISGAVAEFLVGAHLKSSFGKERSGAGGVVGVLGYIWIIPFFVGGSFWTPERLPTAEENPANESIPIDSAGDGLAESAIGEPSQFVRWDKRFSRCISAGVLIEPDEAGVGGGATIENGEAVALRVTIDPRHVIGGEALGIGLAGGEGQGAGVGIFD